MSQSFKNTVARELEALRRWQGQYPMAHRDLWDLSHLPVHALVVAGVFHRSPDGPRFVAQAPTNDDLAIVARDVHHALARLPAIDTRDAALATLQRAARPRRTIDRATAPPRRPSGTSVDLAGVAVFAGAPLPADDRAPLRRLCDYVTRPTAKRLAMFRGNPDQPPPGGAAHARDIVTRLIAGTPDEPAVSVRIYHLKATVQQQVVHNFQPPGEKKGCTEPKRAGQEEAT